MPSSTLYSSRPEPTNLKAVTRPVCAETLETPTSGISEPSVWRMSAPTKLEAVTMPAELRLVAPMRPAVMSPVRFASLTVGASEKTRVEVPVSSVIAEARLALLGVARKVATLAPRPATPVLIGSPVASARSNAGVASAAPRATLTPPNETVLLVSWLLSTVPVRLLVARLPSKVVAVTTPVTVSSSTD